MLRSWVFLSELTSNTAQVATMVPVGTPPNAIVFGTGLVRLPQMMKAGVWLHLAGILVITALATLFL